MENSSVKLKASFAHGEEGKTYIFDEVKLDIHLGNVL